ncbi:hypothetical protein O1611_g321 [Lasiodiplodia mahajangana]|uniref:Uncharacterized protein n=1 Tax=Lasiodiplodia mahajangana TaxID=1108764 RepID=A0ACC2K0S3_9PEZI|nr:hypothetical protein O1611_g321 [Lasiodiplodia mahajangana]
MEYKTTSHRTQRQRKIEQGLYEFQNAASTSDRSKFSAFRPGEDWLLGLSLFAAMIILLGFFSSWAFDDDLCGFPFPGPRLTTQLDRSCQNEALEMQPIHDEGINCRWARMPYSNSSTYGYCPVNGEVAVDDNPPPYTVLPELSNAIMMSNTAITDDALAIAPHYFTNDKTAEPQERARSPTGQQG